MRRHSFHRLHAMFILLVMAGAALPVFAEPPSDEAISKLTEAFDDWVQENRSKGLTREMAAEYATEALADVDFSEMTFKQISELQGMVGLVPQATEIANLRLSVLAEQDDADGAAAAVMHFQMAFDGAEAAELASLLKRCITHPGLDEAFADGAVDGLFGYMPYVSEAALVMITDELVTLERLYTDDITTSQLQSGAGYVKMLQNLSEHIDSETRERIRVKMLTLHEKAKENMDASDERAVRGIDNGIAFLNSSIGRGEFFGNPAPELSFIWSSGDTTISTLSELKGTVVVLDFWATWCGPCIRSFPDVAKLQARYTDYDVLILGVTSLQGKHYPPDGEPIETEGDPEKEFSLMSEFIGQKEMTWTVAFTEQGVYNPDYGVSGIPHVAIIDAMGNVRYNGLHPSSEVTPFSEKTSKIDKLLKEAGLDAPEPYVEHDEDEESS